MANFGFTQGTQGSKDIKLINHTWFNRLLHESFDSRMG